MIWLYGRNDDNSRLNSGIWSRTRQHQISWEPQSILVHQDTLNFTRQWQKETQQIQVRYTHCLFNSIPRFHDCPTSPQSAMLTYTNGFYTENKATKSGKPGNAEAK